MTGNQASRDDTHREGVETGVTAYLQEHPEFFDRHPRLLTQLRIPHPSGDAVSLIERQVDTLRTQLNLYQQRLQAFVKVAEQNDLLTQRLHRLTLALIDDLNFDEVLNTLEDHLHDEFKADAVELKLFSASRVRELQDTDSGDDELRAFVGFFEKGRPACGPLEARQLQYLFGPEAEDTHSAALIPLRAEELIGLLAIGSADQGRFHAAMGTDFLVRLGEIVSHKLQAVSLPGA